MRWQTPPSLILTFALACSSNDNSEGADSSATTSTSASTSTDTGSGSGTDTGSETGAEQSCDAMQATLDTACLNPSVHAYVWDGQNCVYIEGCDCMGPDCDALFTGFPKDVPEHACWTTYIDAGCMTDPCDCPAGEYCVGYYDGTCVNTSLMCTAMPAGCENNPEDCAGGCPEQICGTGNECSAPPCGAEWPNAVYCYGS